MSSALPKRKFSHLKFSLLLIYVLTLYNNLENQQIVCVEQFYHHALYFLNQTKNCSRFIHTLAYDDAYWLQNIILHPYRLKRRPIQILKSTTTPHERIITKCPTRANKIINNLVIPLKAPQLREKFLFKSHIGSWNFCPLQSIDNFVKFLSLHSGYDESLIWLYALHDIQLLLLPYLSEKGFPVPRTYAVCGFTHFQQQAGVRLGSFTHSSFALKLQIAQQLIEGALKFSYGAEGYRIYLTDVTYDNVVYNDHENRLYFIDLDVIFVVKANETVKPNVIHRQLYRKCVDCFAYEPSQLCEHGLSDINLLSACALLRDNPKQQRGKGFLYPIPAEYEILNVLLNQCVGQLVEENGDFSSQRYENVENEARFVAAEKLIRVIDDILIHFI